MNARRRLSVAAVAASVVVGTAVAPGPAQAAQAARAQAARAQTARAVPAAAAPCGPSIPLFYAEDAAMTPDGRFIAFVSNASDVVPGDTNDVSDVFVRDRWTGVTSRLSVSGNGRQGNGDSMSPAISDDGRYVTFTSLASNLVPGDTNGPFQDPPGLDVFVRDRSKGTTTRVNVSGGGAQANDVTLGDPAISANGRYVAFVSAATNLVPGDTQDLFWDVYLRDRWKGTTSRISVGDGGIRGSGSSVEPVLSGNGRYVSFTSEAGLVPGDTNDTWDVYVRDRWNGRTSRVSVSSSGVQGDWTSQRGSMSRDGRYVTFVSFAANLVPGDTNGADDIFVHDRRTRATTRVSVSSAGVQGNYGPTFPANPTVSADGRYVAFATEATNLVPGDTNASSDVFVRDRWKRTTTRISLTPAGTQFTDASHSPSMTPNGRLVIFGAPGGLHLRRLCHG